MYIATNSNWGTNQTGSIFVDNLRIEPIVPDLDEDMDVDAMDWTHFLTTHPTTLPTGLTAQQRFLQGDLDGDGDNDFGDFLIFEATYDEVNGLGAFQEMLHSVPEPCAWLALVVPGIWWLQRGRRGHVGNGPTVLLVLLLLGMSASSASCQLLNSWETGLEGWQTVTFGVPATISTSTIGATHGVQSLAIEQSEGNVFSWNAQVNYGTGSAPYTAIANAVNTGLEHFALEFDATFDTSFIPQGSVTYVSISVALNSAGGWFEYGGAGFSPGNVNETVHISIPLDQTLNPPTNGTGQWVPSNQTGYYQINLDQSKQFAHAHRLEQSRRPEH
jgi:hypothetical protein